ncbi:MAG TPA: DUF1697 domain-containing protein [Actinospica sp.]|nr:DUF1697 domain-containing protein [Actinospica sp.]
MGRQIALLRAVNVGKRQVPMAKLRELMAAAGFEDVATYLQSGNVLLADGGRSAAENGARLEKLLEEEFGFPVECVMRTTKQLDAVLAANPLPDRVADAKRYVVTFFDHSPGADLVAALKPEDFAPDEFAFIGDELYSWSPNGVHTSKFTQQFLTRKLKVQVATGRNWDTVRKLRELAGD